MRQNRENRQLGRKQVKAIAIGAGLDVSMRAFALKSGFLLFSLLLLGAGRLIGP